MTKYIGFGTKLEFTVSTPYDTELGQVISIEGPTAERSDVDVTTLDNTDDYRIFIAGLCDPGTVTLEVAYDPASTTQQAVSDALDTGAETDWRITDGGSSTVLADFKAYVKSWSTSHPLDDLQTLSITLKVSGDPSWPS